MNSSILPAAISVFVLASCSSMTSRFMGEKGDTSTSKNINGLPIVVERPKWLKATYKTVKTGIVAPGHAGQNETAGYSIIKEVDTKKVEFEVVPVGETYALDIKRPLAGTSDWDIQFPEGKQYPKDVKGKVDDKSVAEVTAAIQKLAALANPATAARAGAQASDGNSLVHEVSLGEVINRIEFYDIENPDRGPVMIFDEKGRQIPSYHGK
jgi:hypothetical protein